MRAIVESNFVSFSFSKKRNRKMRQYVREKNSREVWEFFVLFLTWENNYVYMLLRITL